MAELNPADIGDVVVPSKNRIFIFRRSAYGSERQLPASARVGHRGGRVSPHQALDAPYQPTRLSPQRGRIDVLVFSHDTPKQGNIRHNDCGIIRLTDAALDTQPRSMRLNASECRAALACIPDSPAKNPPK